MAAAGINRKNPASMPALIAGFASIYIIWGSTYLAIRFVVETLPPILTAGVRFLTAGSILWFILRLRGAPKPTAKQWRSDALVGTLMLAGGNGLVSWSEQWIPSGIAALIVGTMPLWMVLLDWILHRNKRPTALVFLGLAIGFGGVALLMKRDENAVPTSTWGVAALLLACVFWAYGSLRSRRVDQGPSILVASAMQMIGGGAAMLIIGSLIGEWSHFNPAAVSSKSLLAVGYLIVAGSLIGFTSYVWLLSVASPTAVSTYAYVNPVVAVFLGWWLGKETITSNTIIAGTMVVGAVALMTLKKGKPRAAAIASVPLPDAIPAQQPRNEPA